MEFLFTLIVLAFILDQFVLDGVGRKALVQIVHQKVETKALPAGKPKTDPHDCEVYDERQVDLKMVKAGLMKPHEVAHCDNLRCGNCYS